MIKRPKRFIFLLLTAISLPPAIYWASLQGQMFFTIFEVLFLGLMLIILWYLPKIRKPTSNQPSTSAEPFADTSGVIDDLFAGMTIHYMHARHAPEIKTVGAYTRISFGNGFIAINNTDPTEVHTYPLGNIGIKVEMSIQTEGFPIIDGSYPLEEDK